MPQGSILGPTSFLLFINDLPFCINYCSSDFYSNDSTLHVSGKSKNEIESKIQFDSDETNAWSKRNKMDILYKKTTCMTVGTEKKLSHTEKLNIKIENNEIEPVSSQKLLGLHIDENLN